MLLPWTTDIYQALLARAQAKRLPHAMLLSGCHGRGKRALALALSQRLLCQAPLLPSANQEACGQCKACLLVTATHHPDFLEICAERDGGPITVDQVRELNRYVSLKSQLGGMQIVLIQNAEALNRNAANSLLKTLEEPAESVLLLLLTAEPQRLLPTIRSRCQQIRIPVPDPEVGLRWLAEQLTTPVSDTKQRQALQLAQAAPLLARSLLEEGVLDRYESQRTQFYAIRAGKLSAIEVAANWLKHDAKQSLQWVWLWVADALRVNSRLPSREHYSDEIRQSQAADVVRIDAGGLYAYYDKIQRFLRLADTQANQQLILEDVLLNWQQLGHGSSGSQGILGAAVDEW